MTENEKFDLILTKLEKLDNLESDMQIVKNEIQELKQKATSLELHIENATDKNIQLLAENFVELTKKLNQAIPVADKNLAYEVKVNYLLEEVQNLKEELKILKGRIA